MATRKREFLLRDLTVNPRVRRKGDACSPMTVRIVYRPTYFNSPCCICGKPAHRRVGSRGWCAEHALGAWEARRLQMANPAYDLYEEEGVTDGSA